LTAKCAIVLSALLLVATSASAQQVSLQAATGAPIKCSDFKTNTDGSWTPVIDVIETGTGGKNRLTAYHSTIRPGATFSGVDVAAALTRQCH
jgi:hypothetical protein